MKIDIIIGILSQYHISFGKNTTRGFLCDNVNNTGNGISAALDIRHYSFVNCDLTIHLLRRPVGEWICLQARSAYGGNGSGLAESALYDETGLIALYLEGLNDGRRFLSLCREITRHKPVVLWKVGTTEGGKKAAGSHTGSLQPPLTHSERYKREIREVGTGRFRVRQ